MYYIYILHISIFCKSICIHWPSIYSQPGLASHLFDRKMNKITPSTSSEFKRKIMENHPIPSSEEMNSAWTKLWILATTVSLQKPGDSKRHLGAINIHQKNDKYIYIYIESRIGKITCGHIQRRLDGQKSTINRHHPSPSLKFDSYRRFFSYCSMNKPMPVG